MKKKIFVFQAEENGDGWGQNNDQQWQEANENLEEHENDWGQNEQIHDEQGWQNDEEFNTAADTENAGWQNNEEFNTAATDTENVGWQNNEEFNTATDTENAGWQNDEEYNTAAVDYDNAGWQNEEDVENQDGFTTADGDENAWQAEEVNDHGKIDSQIHTILQFRYCEKATKNKNISPFLEII